MSTSLHWLTLIFYLLGAVLHLAFVIRQNKAVQKSGQALLWLGFLSHSLALISIWRQSAGPHVTSLGQALDFISWALMGLSLIFNLRLRMLILSALVAPACVLLLLGSSALPPPAVPAPEMFLNFWLAGHILALLLGYSLLALNFLGALLYLSQDYFIRHKKLGRLHRRLPSLNRLEQLNRLGLTGGFTLLTLGLISGSITAHTVLGSYWQWDPKQVWALITWLLYAALIHARLSRGWQGRRGAWLSLLAFCALLFTFLGAGLFLNGYHSFSSLPGLLESLEPVSAEQMP